jgi:hypothetical protein
MPSHKVGEYLIVNLTPTKRGLVKCIHASDKRYKGVLEEERTDGKTSPPLEFNGSEVVANLGHAPKVGSVYGISIEPLHQTQDSSFWGQIRIYQSMDEKRLKNLKRGMQKARDVITDRKLPKVPFDTEVRNPHGKMAGYYKYRSKAEFDVLCIKPDETLPESDLGYVIFHEYGHGIWFRHMTPKQRMEWIHLYHDSVALSKVDRKELKALLTDLKTNGDLDSFIRECDDVGQRTMRAVIRHIKQVHSVEKKHFALALLLGNDIDVYWPSAVELGEKNVLLTEYAKKSPEELFAEAFGLTLAGKKLPSRVRDLLDKTLRSLKPR